MKKILNYINGELVEPFSGSYLENYNPSNGKVYSLIPDSDKQDVLYAVNSAKNAFPSWKNTPKQERSNLLMKLADLIDKNFEELVKAESKDNGKPESLAAKVDIPRASVNLRFFLQVLFYMKVQMSMRWMVWRSIILCVNQLAWQRAFHHGIYLFIF